MSSTLTFTHAIEIDAPAALAWSVVADYARDVEWRSGVTRMEPTPTGLVQVGTTTSEEMKVAGKVYRNDGEVVSVDPGARFDWRTTAGASASGHRQVTPIGEGRCQVQLGLNVTPTGVNRLLAPVLGKVLDKGLAGDLRQLRQVVEAELASQRTPARPGR